MEMNSYRKTQKNRVKEIVDILSNTFDRKYREGRLKRMAKILDLSRSSQKQIIYMNWEAKENLQG